mmetsp:Transcript_100546/g.324475  ORF Transcript_100546/g.324475 Transcript_100546/m.324475 type:complete len:265 (-) Transcript_100546:822-1616(-)
MFFSLVLAKLRPALVFFRKFSRVLLLRSSNSSGVGGSCPFSAKTCLASWMGVLLMSTCQSNCTRSLAFFTRARVASSRPSSSLSSPGGASGNSSSSKRGRHSRATSLHSPQTNSSSSLKGQSLVWPQLMQRFSYRSRSWPHSRPASPQTKDSRRSNGRCRSAPQEEQTLTNISGISSSLAACITLAWASQSKPASSQRNSSPKSKGKCRPQAQRQQVFRTMLSLLGGRLALVSLHSRATSRQTNSCPSSKGRNRVSPHHAQVLE